MKPVVAIYSTFLQRAYDQLIHDVALQKLPVVFALDRAGLVGSDGATHHGSYDLSFLRCIPNMVIMAPADENECRQMLYTATTLDGPAAVRYPRGSGPGVAIAEEMTALPVGRAELRRRGGSGLAIARLRRDAAARDARWPSASMPPWSTCASSSRWTSRCCARSPAGHAGIVTIEENVVGGGRRQRLRRGARCRGDHDPAPAPRHPRPLHRARQPR